MTHSSFRPLATSKYPAAIDNGSIANAVIGSAAAASITRSFVGSIYPSAPVVGPDVGHSDNAFVHECFMDELAASGKTDPLTLRRKLMKPYPVALSLIDRIEEMSDWQTPLPKGKARGFAFTLSRGTWIADIVQVSQDESGIRIEKVFCAADPGIVLDEQNFKAQLRSGIIHSLSEAVAQKIAFDDGVAEQANFADHEGLGTRQSPEIEIAILGNSRHIGGPGEPAIPPVRPALANALFALTGKRLRGMPLGNEVTFA